MFEHSNIIRLRFSRTNFFYERTFVDARWSIFGSNIAERSFGLARGSHACMALLLKSCADASTLVISRGAFDLSPIAEPDQMERPGRAFDLAVLPVLSDPEPLEQCSNGSAP